MPDSNLEKLPNKTYLSMIENSVGTKMFNKAFVRNKTTNDIIDVLEDGAYSCAFYVSSILTIFGIIDRPHSTVETVVNKIKEREDWEEVVPDTGLKGGDIIVWEDITYEDGSVVPHMGFYLDEERAVSASWTKREISMHHPTFKTEGGTERKVVRAFRWLAEK